MALRRVGSSPTTRTINIGMERKSYAIEELSDDIISAIKNARPPKDADWANKFTVVREHR